MRADDDVWCAANCDEIFVRVQDALVVVIYSVPGADDLASSRYAHEERRAGLLEFCLGRIERDAGGDVLEDLAHMRTVDRGGEEGSEGRTGVRERDVTESRLQHVPESV